MLREPISAIENVDYIFNELLRDLFLNDVIIKFNTLKDLASSEVIVSFLKRSKYVTIDIVHLNKLISNLLLFINKTHYYLFDINQNSFYIKNNEDISCNNNYYIKITTEEDYIKYTNLSVKMHEEKTNAKRT